MAQKPGVYRHKSHQKSVWRLSKQVTGQLDLPFVNTIDLTASFKAYDVRGIVGETITAETVRATGAAFVDVLGLAGQDVLVGADMRPSGPEFMAAFAEGATARGANVINIGLISTDELYFACGVENAAGVTFTASHNPAEYNGMKMSKAGAVPLSSESGLFDIRDLAQKYLNEGEIPSVENPGSVSEKDVLKAYAEYLRARDAGALAENFPEVEVFNKAYDIILPSDPNFKP